MRNPVIAVLAFAALGYRPAAAAPVDLQTIVDSVSAAVGKVQIFQADADLSSSS